IDVYDPIIRRVALASGLPVAAIDFPLVPDIRFPDNLKACARFVRKIAGSSSNGSIGLLGDSAGANLALAAAVLLKASGDEVINSLGLVYGNYDLLSETGSHHRHGDGSTPLTLEGIQKSRALYIPDEADRCNPLVSPIRADLRGLPP